jgi:hypothetical protein
LPTKGTLVIAQVSWTGGVILTFGNAVLDVTATVAVFVQPLLGFVTVRV